MDAPYGQDNIHLQIKTADYHHLDIHIRKITTLTLDIRAGLGHQFGPACHLGPPSQRQPNIQDLQAHNPPRQQSIVGLDKLLYVWVGLLGHSSLWLVSVQ